MIKGSNLSSYCIDTLYEGVQESVCLYTIKSNGGDAALFDTGTPRSYNKIKIDLENLGITKENLTKIIVSHIHLDHCGNISLLARDFPKAKFYIHSNGVSHIINPNKLINQSKRIFPFYFEEYGDNFNGLPEDRIVSVDDDMKIEFDKGGTLDLIQTPGHCNHHICAIDTQNGIAYTGDAYGSCFDAISPNSIFASIAPPQFNPILMRRSTMKIMETEAKYAALTHYGFHKQFLNIGINCLNWIDRMTDIAENEDDVPTSILNEYTNLFGAKLHKNWHKLHVPIKVCTQAIQQYAKKVNDKVN